MLADERRLIGGSKRAADVSCSVRTLTASHLNEATWRLVLGISYFNGRRFGGRRAEGWPWPVADVRGGLSLAQRPTVCERRCAIFASPRTPPFNPQTAAGAMAPGARPPPRRSGGDLARGPKRVFDFVDDEEFDDLERLGAKLPRNERITRFIGPRFANVSQRLQ